MERSSKSLAAGMLLAFAIAALAMVAVVMGGLYDFSAEVEHTPAVRQVIDYARERSIARRSAGIPVPDLSHREAIVKGAGNYEAMCAQCHLAPAMEATELSKGLYPVPPELAKNSVAPSTVFWTVKHGIKASGMPAWGRSMSDEDIWNLVAFVQQLPRIDANQYRELVAASEGHSHKGAHGH